MKLLAINGSPRARGNTALAIDTVSRALSDCGVETEVLHVGGMNLRGCAACGGCVKLRDGRCAMEDDGLNQLMIKLKEADGLLLASPVHYSDVSARIKCFLDRAFYVSNNSGNFLRHKVGAALVVTRRMGGSHALDTLVHYLTYSEMVVPGSFYWCVSHGGITPGEVREDVEGMQTLARLGHNMAWAMKALDYARDAVPPPEPQRRTLYSYIRP